jgi:hypothetical protein
MVNPRHKQRLQEMAAAWDMLAIERKLDLEEKPDPSGPFLAVRFSPTCK